MDGISLRTLAAGQDPRESELAALWPLLRGAVALPISGLAGLFASVPHPGSKEFKGADMVRAVQEAIGGQGPSDEGSQAALETVTAPLNLLSEAGDWAGQKTTDITGSPALGAGVNAITQVFGPGAAVKGVKVAPKAAKAVGKAGSELLDYVGKEPADIKVAPGQAGKVGGGAPKSVARTRAALTAVFPDDPDIVSSMLSEKKTGGPRVPIEEIEAAMVNRADYRSEKPVLPKPAAEMSDADWKAWGEQFGVDMTVNPSKSLGVSDVATKREIMVPGGLEGKFTIPDVFQLKSQNFDPNALAGATKGGVPPAASDVHEALQHKFIRSYAKEGGADPVDLFNKLSFGQLSGNAPLTPNEFLSSRFRLRTPEELKAMSELDVGDITEKGMQSAARGGMGAKGTADLENLPRLAYILQHAPEAFNIHPGETMVDLARRVMNQVPGLGQKTASLAVPWIDLPRANTSAVDLHMIRHGFHQLMEDPQLGSAFTERLAKRLDRPGASVVDLVAEEKADPNFAKKMEEAAIGVIGADKSTSVYRRGKAGELPEDLHPSLAPEKLAYEPKSVRDFGRFYNKIVEYVSEGRGSLPVFGEQWRLWDRFRERVEPHEIMHPDYRKLPRLSWEELKAAFDAHKEAGYTASANPEKGTNPIVGKDVPWGRLFHGKATPEMLAALAAGGVGSAALAQILGAMGQGEKK